MHTYVLVHDFAFFSSAQRRCSAGPKRRENDVDVPNPVHVPSEGKMTWMCMSCSVTMCPILCQKVFVHVTSEICAHKVEETGVAVLEENPGCADSKRGVREDKKKRGVSEDKKKRLRGDSYRFRGPIIHRCQDRACKNIENEEILEFVFITVMHPHCCCYIMM